MSFRGSAVWSSVKIKKYPINDTAFRKHFALTVFAFSKDKYIFFNSYAKDVCILFKIMRN